MIGLFINILNSIPQDSLAIANEVSHAVANTNSSSNTIDIIFKLIIIIVGGVAAVWKLVDFLIKKAAERKDKAAEAKLERDKNEQLHSNQLETEMFRFDKEKYMNLQEANQNFQNTIINEIFGKFVKQSQWIADLHDKSIENLVKQMTEVYKVTKDLYVQNDVLTNRIRSLEDRFIKNSNILTKQLDIIIKMLIEKSNEEEKKVASKSGSSK